MKIDLPKMNLIKVSLCAALAPLLLATHAMGAVITWTTSPTTVVTSDVSSVITTGALVTAVWMDSSAGTQAINGVTFTDWHHASNVSSFATFWANTNANLPSPVGAYQTLLSYGTWGSNGPLVTFTGLTPGDNYELQVWTPYWDGNNFSTTYSSSAIGGDSGALNLGTTSGGSVVTPPQYVLGTFTAGVGETTQSLYFRNGSGIAMIGAFELRDLSTVPEPTTVALLSLGVVALVIRRRFRLSTAA